MTDQAKKVLEDLIKNMPSDQPFTIKEFVRQYVQKAAGQDWQGIWEVAMWEEIENYLLERKLIQKYGQATLYTTTQEAKKL